MAWPLIVMAVGAGIMAGATAGGASEDDSYTAINTPKSILETEYASVFLSMAKTLSQEADDPRVKEDIYKMLPASSMNSEDRAKFTSEFAVIKKEIANYGMNQSAQAFGKNIDKQVAKGTLSQKTADKMKTENTAALNSVMSIYNKRLDATRIQMARNEYFKKGSQKLDTAGLISNVDNANKSVLNAAVNTGINYYSTERGRHTELLSAVRNANSSMAQGMKAIKNDFVMGAISLGARAGGQAYGAYLSNKQSQDENNRIQSLQVGSGGSATQVTDEQTAYYRSLYPAK